MTDGEQTVEKNSTKSDIEILTEASKPLKDKGVRIISLGIGRRANKKSLEAISSGSDVYSSESFSKLRLLVRKLKKGTCQGEYKGIMQSVSTGYFQDSCTNIIITCSLSVAFSE